MNTRIFLVASLLGIGALALAGCPGPEYPKCEKDDQCKKDKDGKAVDQYCLFGQCQECAKDSHCEDGERCNRGRCDKVCTSDDACGTGQICEDQACAPAQCSEVKACSGGMACEKGRCVQPATTSSGGGTSTGPLTCERKARVSFDFNVFDLRPDARETLDNFAKCLAQNTDWKLTVEGHADERGTTEYNLQLGEKRAGSIKDYLVRLGVEKARVKTISYGEERPVETSGSESAWAANRRGELIVQ
jgi:peptidoglycan-associated lipoprotein